MSKINVDRVEIKNFLSYGNQWTVFDFHEGINVVLGYDKDKDRSNGAGKCVRGNTEVVIEIHDPIVMSKFKEFIGR